MLVILSIIYFLIDIYNKSKKNLSAGNIFLAKKIKNK